jgi:PAS domain S-box-containing protein
MVAIGKERTDKKDNVKGRMEPYFKKILQPEARLKFSFDFDFASVGCYISDLKGTFIDINKVAERITGYTRDELSGKNYHKAGLLSLKDVARVMESLAKNKKSLPAEPEEYVLTGKDKKPIDVEISTFPIKINREELALGVIRDISKCKKAERALKESEKEKSAILNSPFQEVQKKLDNITNAIIKTISKIMDTRDPYTAGHQKRVAQLAFAISREMKLSSEKIKGIRIASQIHDIGKIGIPVEILTKPSALDSVEFSFMKKHPVIGYDILKDIDFPYPIAQIVLQHHERIDGSGYPDGLRGDKILLEAKIVAVADVVEAMSSHRPYREALGVDVALEEIEKNKGILYEPEIVDVCIKLFREKGFKFR